MNKLVDTANVVSLSRNTLYTTQNRSDAGLAIARDAKAVVIQDEDGDTDVVTNFSDVESAVEYLVDPDDTTGVKEYEGKIVAVLNANGAAQWVVFDSDTPLVTGGQAENTGRDGLLTYTARNFNGYVVVNWTMNAPEYAARGTDVDYAINVYADDVLIHTSSTLTFHANDGTGTGRWSDVIFDETAVITVELVENSVTVEDVAIKYVDGDTNETIYMQNWQETINENVMDTPGNQTSTQMGVDSATPGRGFEVVTDDTTQTLRYTVTGMAADASNVEDQLFNTNNQARQLFASGLAEGDDFVTVTIYGLSDLVEQYDVVLDSSITGDAAAAIDHLGTAAIGTTMNNFGLVGGTDYMVIRFDKVTGINNGEDVQLTAEVDSGISQNVAYDISVVVNGVTYDFDNLIASDHAKSVWIENVTSDLEVEEVTVSVAIENFAIENAVVENNGRSLRITFNERVISANNTAVDSADFDVTGAEISRDVVVSGNTVTLTFNEALADGDTIQIDDDTVAGEVISNTLNGNDTIRINMTGTSYDACTYSNT